MAAQDYEQVTYNSADGAQIGQSSTEKVALFGATPVTQPIAALTTVGIASLSTTQTAALTTTQLATLCVNIDALTVGLRALGIVAT